MLYPAVVNCLVGIREVVSYLWSRKILGSERGSLKLTWGLGEFGGEPQPSNPCSGDPATLLFLGGWGRIQVWQGKLEGSPYYHLKISSFTNSHCFHSKRVKVRSISPRVKRSLFSGNFADNYRKKSSQALVSFPCRRYWLHLGRHLHLQDQVQ